MLRAFSPIGPSTCISSTGERTFKQAQMFAHRRPNLGGCQFALAAQVQRAFRQQARRAFDVAAHDSVAPCLTGVSSRIIGAEKRHASRPGMGRQMRQRTVRRDDQAVPRQHGQGPGQRRCVEKLHAFAEFVREGFAQSATAVQARHGHPAAALDETVGDVPTTDPTAIRGSGRSPNPD